MEQMVLDTADHLDQLGTRLDQHLYLGPVHPKGEHWLQVEEGTTQRLLEPLVMW